MYTGVFLESALLDGMMLLKEKEASTVLVGAIDEIIHIVILNRMGLYKQGPVSNPNCIKQTQKEPLPVKVLVILYAGQRSVCNGLCQT